MDKITKELLEQVAGLHEIPVGAYNIRKDGELYGRNVSANINIVTKTDNPGIDTLFVENLLNKMQNMNFCILCREKVKRDYLFHSQESN